MARATSLLYEVLEEPASQTSAGTGDIKTFKPSGGKRAVAVEICCETTDARVTCSGADPGVGAAPGLVVKAGAQPIVLPYPVTANTPLKVASNAAGNSQVSVRFLV